MPEEKHVYKIHRNTRDIKREYVVRFSFLFIPKQWSTEI